MAVNKYVYEGNNNVYDSTEILVIGDYAATQGQVVPVTQDDLAKLGNNYRLTQTDAEITAIKVGEDPNALSDLIEQETIENHQNVQQAAVVQAPASDGASSSSTGNLKDAPTGSGGAK